MGLFLMGCFLGDSEEGTRHSQRREIRIPAPGPPKILMGKTYFSWKIIWTRAAPKNRTKKVLQPVPVRRSDLPDLGKRTISAVHGGKRPIKDGKRPIKANGLFSAPPPCHEEVCENFDRRDIAHLGASKDHDISGAVNRSRNHRASQVLLVHSGPENPLSLGLFFGSCLDKPRTGAVTGKSLDNPKKMGNQMGGFRKGVFRRTDLSSNPTSSIASEVSILSKNSLATTDFHAKKTQHVQLFGNPLPGTPHSRFPGKTES